MVVLLYLRDQLVRDNPSPRIARLDDVRMSRRLRQWGRRSGRPYRTDDVQLCELAVTDA